MDARYTISQLVELAFGIKSPVFIPYPIEISTPALQSGFSGMELKVEDYGETETSWLGTPIVHPFKVLGGRYKVYNQDAAVELQDFEDFSFPPVTLIDFEREKLWERTVVAGGKSSVKEVYGFDDWVCRVRGLCLNEGVNGKTAQQYKEGLLQLENIVDTLKVSSALFAEKRIDSIFISKIRLRQLEGKPNVIPFEFDVFSDDPLELVL